MLTVRCCMTFLLLLFLFPILSLVAQNVEANEDYYAASKKTYTAIKWQPIAMWEVFSDDDLDYSMEPVSFTTYHGSFWHKWGIRLNVDIDIDDNFIGKLHRIVGWLGFKRFSVRASNGSLSGIAHWNGEEIPGYAEEKNFNSKFTTVELLYDFYFPDDPSTVVYSNGVPVYGTGKTGVGRGTYIGLMYTTVELPVRIGTNSGYKDIAVKNIFDTVKFQNYGLTFGFDNMDGWFMYGIKTESKYTKGFSFWLSSYLSLWLGTVNISSSSLNKLQELNPEIKINDAALFSFGIQFDALAGLCYLAWIKNVQVGIALAYEFSGRAIGSSNGYVFGNEDNIAPEGTVYTGYGYSRHGPVIKIGISF